MTHTDPLLRAMCDTIWWQACAYKIGEVAIWKMRRKAEAALGPEGFNLKKFHTCVLRHGPLPLDTLDSLVDMWIKQQQEDQGGKK